MGILRTKCWVGFYFRKKSFDLIPVCRQNDGEKTPLTRFYTRPSVLQHRPPPSAKWNRKKIVF
jgi:hypothetical protein